MWLRCLNLNLEAVARKMTARPAMPRSHCLMFVRALRLWVAAERLIPSSQCLLSSGRQTFRCRSRAEDQTIVLGSFEVEEQAARKRLEVAVAAASSVVISAR